MALKKGDKVKVYQRPITKEKLEGIATLVTKCFSNEMSNTEVWNVRFENDKETVARTINKN